MACSTQLMLEHNSVGCPMEYGLSRPPLLAKRTLMGLDYSLVLVAYKYGAEDERLNADGGETALARLTQAESLYQFSGQYWRQDSAVPHL